MAAAGKVMPKPNREKQQPCQSVSATSNSCDNRYKSWDQREVVHNRIYVGGLTPHIYEADLAHFFSEFGEVRHVVIITEAGVSRGYGFVTFTTKDPVIRLLG